MAKGLFTPTKPEKYLGDPRKIRFLSSWECRFMVFCDQNPNILAWGSEEFRVKYYNPIKQKVCEYIPDFIIKYKDRNGVLLTEVIEIKPMKQTRISGGKRSTYDQVQLIINHAKWQAAAAFCTSHGIKFRVITEEEMFKQPPKKPAVKRRTK